MTKLHAHLVVASRQHQGRTLLSICLAVLEEDLETLETISKINFARRYGVGEVSAIAAISTQLSRSGVRTASRFSLNVGGHGREFGHGSDVPVSQDPAQPEGKGEGFDFTTAFCMVRPYSLRLC